MIILFLFNRLQLFVRNCESACHVTMFYKVKKEIVEGIHRNLKFLANFKVALKGIRAIIGWCTVTYDSVALFSLTFIRMSNLGAVLPKELDYTLSFSLCLVIHRIVKCMYCGFEIRP